MYCVPRRLDLAAGAQKAVLFFRTRAERGRTRMLVKLDGREVLRKTYRALRPPEMERVELEVGALGAAEGSVLEIMLEEVG